MEKKKLKIAVAVTSRVKFPMPGNTHYSFFSPLRVALDIADGLAKSGHDITFFGPRGSKSKLFKTFIVPIFPVNQNRKILKMEGIPESKLQIKDREKMIVLLEQYFLSYVFKEAMRKKFDILHIHAPNESLPLSFLLKQKTPIVYTIHDVLFPWRKKVFEMFQTKNQYFVSISRSQRKSDTKLNWAGTAYNTVDLKYFPFSLKTENYLLFLGRILPRKGVKEAIQVAIKTNKKLIIIGGPSQGEFWEKDIKPHLKKKNIKYTGYVFHKETHKYYGRAKVLLCPIKWKEPFGLTFIESMACGTPVIAFKRGAAAEIIKDGETGFIVKNIGEMIKATKKIYQMPESEYQKMRYNCRKHIEENFTIEKMIDVYEKVYYEILKKNNQ